MQSFILSRAEQKLQTRDHILAKAVDLFVREGISKTRTLDIAQAASLSHGSVFVHFPTREALLLASIQKIGAMITDELHAAVQGKNTLQTVLDAHLQSLARHESAYRRLLLEAPSLPQECRTLWVGIQSAIAHYILQVAEREMVAGTLRRVSPSLLFNTWLGLIHHYLLNQDLFAPGQPILPKYGNLLLNHYLELLAPCPQGESNEQSMY